MRMVIVSNRLPIVVEEKNDGAWHVSEGAGGLVTALGPVLRRHHGVWIGWPGGASTDEATLQELLAQHARQVGYELKPVPMSQDEVEGFYQGYCNEIIWPLFHDLQSQCNFVPDYWTLYQSVKRRYAEVVRKHVAETDFVWVHDYHLMGLGRHLREGGMRNRLGFFLHTPFPPPDIFCKLPWRTDVLRGLLYYDVVGFQTPRDRENFLDCARKLLPGLWMRRRGGMVTCLLSGRASQIGVFPIGIDANAFARTAAGPAVTERVKVLRGQMPDQQIILGLDRLDYTKGIPDRLRAFHLALQRHSELHRKVILLQVVVPSREALPGYQELKAQIERLVTQINGEFTQPGWVPIQHVFRSLEWEELLAYYRLADVGLVTPLKDGMNLVAKEYCACQIEGDGVLILSEFAGAAVQMQRDAVLVNPYDRDQVADAIRTAVTMNRKERRAPMRRLRSGVRRQDVFWWVDRFLTACGLGEQPAEANADQRCAAVG